MAGETSGPGPSEQEIRMVALERKFDELLSFVQLIAKRNTEDENQRKEDDKDTGEAEPEGHSNTNATPPRPPTPPKPEGKDSQLDSKIDSLEEKIRLIQGFELFRKHGLFEHVLVPQYDGATQVQGPGVREIQWERRPHDPSANLKKISHWKELADTFLAQYGFNSQIAPGSVRPSEGWRKKSNETFREYAQRWREKAARARPPLDEREMIKIFVDTLKNPLLRPDDGITNAVLCRPDTAEQAAKKAPTKRKEGDVQMIGRNNGRPRQVLPTFTMQPIQPRPIQAPAPTQAPAPAPAPQMPARPEGNQPNDNRWLRKEPRQFTPLPMPMTELYPILIEKSLISPIVPKPYNGPQRRDFNPNSACDFHFGEVGHTVENCGQLRHRVQDLIDHGVLKFEGLPNITTNPLPKHPEGGVNMVEVEEGNEESIAWRRLFYTLEKRRHITPLDAPPGPSTGDACEYHSGARGHSLDCCEEFKKKVTDLMENGIVGREEIPSKGSRQPDDPSEFDWYAEINLDDIVEDEMDLDNLQDEEADWGYFMEDDTDEWRDVDLTEFFQFPYLIMPPGFVTPEFEIFYEDGDPEVHLQKYGEKMALHLENELLMISVFPESLSKQTAAWFYQLRNLTGWDDLVRVFLERYRFNPHSILEYLGLKKGEEPYIIPDPGVSKAIVEIKEESDMSSLPALAEGGEEEKDKPPPPAKEPSNVITTAVAEEEDAGPMVEGLSIHTIAREEDSTTTPPTRHCQQGEEVKTWTCVPLLQRVSSSNEITRKTSNDPHVSKIDNKTDCSLDNIDNSDEEIELPSDILEALERQDEGSKPNIEELEIVNLAIRGMQARQTSTATDEARSHFEDQGRGGKAIEGRFPKHSNLFGLGSQYSPGAEEGRKSQNQRTSYSHSWTDSQGYNQIKMAEEDKSKTAFVTHWGTFVYDVMPFGLKNAGATYQRAMVTLFHDMIHHEIEVYVDDMIAKSRTAQDHLTDLRKLFQRLKKYQLRLNPNKCAFGVTSGKLLGFIVSGRGIEIDPAKVQAIRSMPAPRTEKEIRSFLGRINYIARFIAQLTATCEPLFKLLRKDDVPSFYTSQSKKHPWAACWDNKTRLGRKEQAIYYLSKKFTEPETRYLLVEKTCCALAWASKKLRQYMLYYTTWLVSRMDPIKRSRDKAIADYLADYPSEQLELMDSEFPDEDVMIVEEDNQGRWKLYFDGAANAVGSGIGAVLVSPKGQQTPIAVKLGFDCTNNMTEYEACIVVSQTNGEWQARDPKLIPYQRYISRLIPKFKYVTFTYTPRAHNHFADALATLASLIKLVEGDDVRPLRIETRDIPAYCVCIEECMNVEAEIDDKPWYYDIKRFIQDREYPSRATENEKKYIRRMAFQFFLSGEILYKRTHDATLLRCVDAEEANRLIQEMHAGLMGAHANGPFLARKIMRAGYYWLTMERDCIRHVQTCHKCQMYQNSKNAPPQYLHTMASPWPFSAWGMDVIGAITPKASNGHEFILVAIDYFTKWVGGMFLQECHSSRGHPVCEEQHHLPLCQQFKIQHHNSAPYRPKMNGAVEAANKNVKKILSKMTETYKDWHEHLPYALCAYRTSVRTSVGATPYSLVYGMEAVLPVEVEIPSLRILSQTQLEEAEWAQARYEQLNFIDEKRLAALCHGQLYQRRIERAYNKKARPRTFQPGDLVLKKRNMALSDPRGKFAPSYEGPYVVKKAFSGGAIILADMDGEEFRSPINSDSVIKYHV
uniref:Integrase catalytic domain-containing protein n=1 Tax=Fagus sylvatica TaxID=28930 RepID=A0A2N9I625_FAGSY